MQRSKQRKAVAALPKFLPAPILKRALKNITNDKTRAKIETRYQRRNAGR